jgi:hypothetical protein
MKLNGYILIFNYTILEISDRQNPIKDIYHFNIESIQSQNNPKVVICNLDFFELFYWLLERPEVKSVLLLTRSQNR